jgi:hypothetical protein
LTLPLSTISGLHLPATIPHCGPPCPSSWSSLSFFPTPYTYHQTSKPLRLCVLHLIHPRLLHLPRAVESGVVLLDRSPSSWYAGKSTPPLHCHLCFLRIAHEKQAFIEFSLASVAVSKTESLCREIGQVLLETQFTLHASNIKKPKYVQSPHEVKPRLKLQRGSRQKAHSLGFVAAIF